MSKRLQTRMVNNGLIAEQRREQMFEVRTGPTYRDAVERYRAALERWRPQIKCVADLLRRTDTRQAEVLASAHFAASGLIQTSAHRREPTPSEAEVVDEVMRWKIRRKPPFEREEIASGVRTLNLLSWIDVQPSEQLLAEPDFAELVG